LSNASAEFVLFGNATGNANCSNTELDTPEQIDVLGDWLFIADAQNSRVIKLQEQQLQAQPSQTSPPFLVKSTLPLALIKVPLKP
jgi:hypothetical protein